MGISERMADHRDLAARSWQPGRSAEPGLRSGPPAPGARAHRHHHWLLWTCGALIAVLIVARLLLPTLMTRALNAKLATLPADVGHVSGISMSLYRGAYQIHGITLISRPGIAPALSITCSDLEIGILWRQLLHGQLVGSVRILEPDVVVSVDPEAGPLPGAAPAAPATASTGPQPTWQQIVQGFFPITLEEIQVAHGRVVYRDPAKDLALTLGDVSVAITNLTNRGSASPGGSRTATFKAQGGTLGQGVLIFGGTIDPFASVPQFTLDLSLEHIDLVQLDPLFMRYEHVDVKKGVANFYLELRCDRGHLAGYLKPLFTDLSIFRLSDVKKHGISAVKEAVIGTAAEIFKNHPRDRFAGELPLLGDLTDPKTSIWRTITSIIRNAFVKALQPGFDPSKQPAGQPTPTQAAQQAQPALHDAVMTPAKP